MPLMELPSKSPAIKKLPLVYIVPFIVLLTLLLLGNSFFSSNAIHHNAKKTAIVKYDSSSQKVNAFGALKSSHQQNIVSKESGTIIKLNLTTGTQVTPDSIIMQLSNQQLARNLEQAKHELELSQGEQALLQAEIQEQELKLENEKKLKQGELSIAKIELEAKKELAKKNIVSSLELKRSELNVQQLALKLSLLANTKQLFNTIKATKLNVSKLKVAEKQNLLINAQSHVNNLAIKANISGRLQGMAKEFRLGDWLQSGDKIAIIADDNDLYAELYINASDVALISEGMTVNLNVKGKAAQGIIKSIAPSVENNQIKLKVAIKSTLPETALPNVEVSAEININNSKAKLLVTKPEKISYVDKHVIELYARSSAKQDFEKREVQIGQIKNNRIEILSGLQAGDEIIIAADDK